jgi:hypothetical protein
LCVFQKGGEGGRKREREKEWIPWWKAKKRKVEMTA